MISKRFFCSMIYTNKSPEECSKPGNNKWLGHLYLLCRTPSIKSNYYESRMSESSNFLWLKQRNAARNQTFKLTRWMLQIPMLHFHKIASKGYSWSTNYSPCSNYYFMSFLGFPELPLYQTAHTYFNVTKSPLVPGFIKGSVAKVSHYELMQFDNIQLRQMTIGWGQVLRLDGKKFTLDPDNPTAKRFNYTWWCRYALGQIFEEENVFKADRLQSSWGMEHVQNWDGRTGHQRGRDHGEIPNLCSKQSPTHSSTSWSTTGWSSAWLLRKRTRAYEGLDFIKPASDHFIQVTGSRLTLNTSSFVTYAQVYELSLIVSKDTRKGMVKMDIDLGVLPVPLLEIDCAAPGLCFPTFGGIFVNPTSRLLQNQ